MPDPNAAPGNTVQNPAETSPKGDGQINPSLNGKGVEKPEQAILGPIPEAVSAAGKPAPGPLADSAAETSGRRVLSTAFVRVGPDGHLTVELRDGRVVVLRDVAMGPKNYCGVQIAGESARGKYCGGYAEVAAARPGGLTPSQPVSAVSKTAEPEPERSPAKGR